MSKLKFEKINFDDDDYVIELNEKAPSKAEVEIETEEKREQISPEVQNNILEEAKSSADEIVKKAKSEASKILEDAKTNAKNIIDTAQAESDSIKENVKKELDETLTQQQEEIEQLRIEKAKEGYAEGHKDGLEKIQEELEEKINSLDKFTSIQFEMKEKILKSLNLDVVNIINSISRKVLFKELDSATLDKIIKNTVLKLSEKEKIKVILSEKYAKLLFELQNKMLDDGTELKFENFKQYENFEIIYNQKFEDDTIIIENLSERFDASISSQLDIIMRDIYENLQNNPLDFDCAPDTDKGENETI